MAVTAPHPPASAGPAIDLNVDLAELPGDAGRSVDARLLESVTSANVACGGHAGDAATMRWVCERAVARGVVVGAHPSYVDREGFGRRAVDVAGPVLRDQVTDQLAALVTAADAAGTRVAYVKPHGALYHRLATDPEHAAAVVDAVLAVLPGVPLVLAPAPPGAREPVGAALARAAGLPVVGEGFAARAYRPDGALAPRAEPGAVLDDPVAAGRQAVLLATGDGVVATDGTRVPLDVATICVHGDAPRAVEVAAGVRSALTAAGVAVRAFAG